MLGGLPVGGAALKDVVLFAISTLFDERSNHEKVIEKIICILQCEYKNLVTWFDSLTVT